MNTDRITGSEKIVKIFIYHLELFFNGGIRSDNIKIAYPGPQQPGDLGDLSANGPEAYQSQV